MQVAKCTARHGVCIFMQFPSANVPEGSNSWAAQEACRPKFFPEIRNLRPGPMTGTFNYTRWRKKVWWLGDSYVCKGLWKQVEPFLTHEAICQEALWALKLWDFWNLRSGGGQESCARRFRSLLPSPAPCEAGNSGLNEGNSLHLEGADHGFH